MKFNVYKLNKNHSRNMGFPGGNSLQQNNVAIDNFSENEITSLKEVMEKGANQNKFGSEWRMYTEGKGNGI